MTKKIEISGIRAPECINGKFNESFNIEIDLIFLEAVPHFWFRVSHAIFGSWPVFQPIFPVNNYTISYKVILMEEITGEYVDRVEVAHIDDGALIVDDSKNIVIPIGTVTPTATPTATPTPTPTLPPRIITCILPRVFTGVFTPRISTNDIIPRISCLQKLL